MDLSTKEGRHEQGQLIQRAVEHARLSVEELANRIGCSRALIYQYLSGTTLAQPDRLQQIAIVTGVPLAYFYGGGGFPDETRKGRRAADREDPQARLVERIRQLEELARAQDSPPDWSALASTCERIISLASQIHDVAAEARALVRLGQARCRLGEFSRAADSLQRAVTLFEALHDAGEEANARQALGHALAATGRLPEARDQFERVARSDHAESRWSGVISLAALLEESGDYRQAMERCDEAATLLEECRDPQRAAQGMLYVHANRINIYLACGDFQSAEPLIQRLLVEAEALGSSHQHLEARLNLAFCSLARGRWAAAHRTLSGALQLARFLGDKSREAMARAVLAILLAALGDYNASIQQAKDGLASALSHGDRRAELFAQMALTDAYAGAARDSEARYHANQALAVATALRLPLYETECRLRLARLCLRADDRAEAQELVDRALARAQQLGARHLEAQARLARGEWRLRMGMATGAGEDALAARDLAVEIGAPPIQWEAEGLRARVASAQEPPRWEEAEEAITRAVALLEEVRTGLRDAGIPDTLLEDGGRQDLYLLRARLLTDTGRAEEAVAFIEQAGWPPLAARYSDNRSDGPGQ